jgi:MerR family transcriptional regulator, heat shock protein HspR
MQISENEPIFSIGVAAKKLDIAVPTMRMYEKAGLIIPYRTDTARRFYSISDLRRITYIRALIKEESLNLAGIRRLMALIPCWELKPCSNGHKEKCPAFNDCKNICWMLPDTLCKAENRNCIDCSVYLQSCETTNNLKHIIYRK